MAQTMESLANPPLWQLMLLESPGVSIVILLLAAMILAIMFHRRRQTGWLKASGVCLLLAAGNFALAELVQTERERLMAAAEQLVDIAGEMDVAALERRVAEGAFLAIRDGAPELNRDELLQTYEAGIARHPIRAQEASILAADLPEPGVGRVDMRVTTTFERNIPGTEQARFTTRWRLVFEQDEADRWLLTEMRWIRAGLHEPRIGWLQW